MRASFYCGQRAGVVKQHFWLLTANIESAETFSFQNWIRQVPAVSLEGVQPEDHQVFPSPLSTSEEFC